ncbi:MAG: hypothetical protein PVG49_16705 [Desulfobacteraceae bacterium]|jgi:hypothetical protein
MYRFTKHAEEEWKKRVKTLPPLPQELDQIIKNSVEVQKYRRVYTPRGRSMTILASFWHPESGVIFKVNVPSKVIVTVFTKDIRQEQRRVRR